MTVKAKNEKGEFKKSVLFLFLENEKGIRNLYGIYSRNFKEHRVIWSRLVKEEAEHVRCLEKLKRKIGLDNGNFKINNHSVGALEYIGNFIKTETNKAELKKIKAEDSFETAIRLERSMIEKKCFDMFDPKDKLVKDVFMRLNKETDSHRKLLERNYKKLLIKNKEARDEKK